MITCWAASQTVTSIGAVLPFSTVAWMLFRNNSPMMYSRCEGMYGKVASRWPVRMSSGRGVEDDGERRDETAL